MITQERLKQLLSYDPDTGEFRWRVDLRRVKPGDIAGKIEPCGYRRITVDQKPYLAHRLAYLYQTGSWPEDMIDHIDRDRANNSWGNLRASTRAQNNINSSVRRENKLGIKGVHLADWLRPPNYIAAITINRRTKRLGRFHTPEEAAEAYRLAAKEQFGEFAA